MLKLHSQDRITRPGVRRAWALPCLLAVSLWFVQPAQADGREWAPSIPRPGITMVKVRVKGVTAPYLAYFAPQIHRFDRKTQRRVLTPYGKQLGNDFDKIIKAHLGVNWLFGVDYVNYAQHSGMTTKPKPGQSASPQDHSVIKGIPNHSVSCFVGLASAFDGVIRPAAAARMAPPGEDGDTDAGHQFRRVVEHALGKDALDIIADAHAFGVPERPATKKFVAKHLPKFDPGQKNLQQAVAEYLDSKHLEKRLQIENWEHAIWFLAQKDEFSEFGRFYLRKPDRIVREALFAPMIYGALSEWVYLNPEHHRSVNYTTEGGRAVYFARLAGYQDVALSPGLGYYDCAPPTPQRGVVFQVADANHKLFLLSTIARSVGPETCTPLFQLTPSQMYGLFYEGGQVALTAKQKRALSDEKMDYPDHLVVEPRPWALGIDRPKDALLVERD